MTDAIRKRCKEVLSIVTDILRDLESTVDLNSTAVAPISRGKRKRRGSIDEAYGEDEEPTPKGINGMHVKWGLYCEFVSWGSIVVRVGSHVWVAFEQDDGEVDHAPAIIESLERTGFTCEWISNKTEDHGMRSSMPYTSVSGVIYHLDPNVYWHTIPVDYKREQRSTAWSVASTLSFHRIDRKHMWRTTTGILIKDMYMKPFALYGCQVRWDIIDEIFESPTAEVEPFFSPFSKPILGEKKGKKRVKGQGKAICGACDTMKDISMSFGGRIMGSNCGRRMECAVMLRDAIMLFWDTEYSKESCMDLQNTLMNSSTMASLSI